MTEQIDQAQELEMRFRERAVAKARQHQEPIAPDEHHGIRYCLDCGIDIPPERMAVQPHAVRCVSCQSRKER